MSFQDAPKHLIQEFINGYIKADGCIHKNNCHQITTVSYNLAFGLQRLLLKLGIIASINKFKRPSTCIIEGRIVNQRDTYQIRYYPESKRQYTSFIEDDYENWWSLKYTMSQDEMNKINSESVSWVQTQDDGYTGNIELSVIQTPKFDGSGLIISSDLIYNGANIPHACWAHGEDTGFMINCMQLMGKSFVQFIVKNVLKVHNRKHPKKRMYVLDEDDNEGIGDRRKKNEKWAQVQQIADYNRNLLGEKQGRFYKVKSIEG